MNVRKGGSRADGGRGAGGSVGRRGCQKNGAVSNPFDNGYGRWG